MAERCGFFDAHLINGEYDRVYLSEQFAKYFASFIGNGIFGAKSGELIVRERETSGMGVTVYPGQAWINGYWYESTDKIHLSVDVADGTLNRIDSVVVRWSNSERNIYITVKKGTPAANPITPTVQRNDDYYELKLADVYVNAGATKISQVNITDKRLNTLECGLVIGVVQQLDAEEFGIQLEAYISEFIAEHDAWKNTTQTNVEQWANELRTSYTSWFIQFKTDCNTVVNNLIAENQTRIDTLLSTGQTNINKLISDKDAEFDSMIAENQQRFDEIMEAMEDFDMTAVIQEVSALRDETSALSDETSALQNDNTAIKNDIEDLKEEVAKPKGMGVEDDVEKGCFYIQTTDGAKEWINAPNKPGVEYRLAEKWNGKSVYSMALFIGALTNKTAMSIEINAEFDKIISVYGYAYDPDNNYSYPFPIILNGLEAIAVISGIEGNGNVSYINININDDLSAFTGYVTIKYTKD